MSLFDIDLPDMHASRESLLLYPFYGSVSGSYLVDVLLIDVLLSIFFFWCSSLGILLTALFSLNPFRSQQSLPSMFSTLNNLPFNFLLAIIFIQYAAFNVLSPRIRLAQYSQLTMI